MKTQSRHCSRCLVCCHLSRLVQRMLVIDGFPFHSKVSHCLRLSEVIRYLLGTQRTPRRVCSSWECRCPLLSPPVAHPVSRHEEATEAGGPEGRLGLPVARVLLPMLQESSEPEAEVWMPHCGRRPSRLLSVNLSSLFVTAPRLSQGCRNSSCAVTSCLLLPFPFS